MKSSERSGLPLRIGTFNGQFLPYMTSCGTRAAMLAEGIAASDYDIIGLNEVFSGRARRALIDRLSAEYPYVVEYVSSHNRLRLDSGLMLFSKLPFDDLADLPESSPVRIRARAVDRTVGSQYVRFDEFGDHLGSDGLATKGAAYVRVMVDGRPLHLFVTHVQASYLNHSVKRYLRTVDIRASQIRQMAGFVRQVLGERARRENVAILGDFNVHFSANGAGYPHRGASLHGDEWDMMFAAFGPVFDNKLEDAWHEYAPAGDLGLTFPSDRPRTRPDYVLLNVADPQQALCVQQVAIAHGLSDSSGLTPRELSDHMGVIVDLNLPMRHCNVAQAHAVSLDGRDVLLDGRIEHEGGLTWYRLDGPGSYQVELVGDARQNGLGLSVFSDTDVSRPLVPESGTKPPENAAPQYELGTTSYIRIGDPRRSVLGEYALRLARIGG